MNKYLIPAWFSLLFAVEGSVQAQSHPSHFVPARPTISPYFAYSAVNTTGLPNYYTYIQPLQQHTQIAAAFTDPRVSLGYENRAVLTERSIAELLDRQLRQRVTTGGGAPSTAATFQTYSHYYPTANPVRRR